MNAGPGARVTAAGRRLGRLSLPDWIFYPAAIGLAALLIWQALSWRPLGDEPRVTETEFLVEGAALSQLIPGPGTRVTYISSAGAQGLARAGAVASIEAAGRLSAGVGAAIPLEFEQRVIGRIVRVEARARAIEAGEPASFHLGYFTVQHDSGWREIPLSEQFSTGGFCFSVPENTELNDEEWIGVWPDAAGEGRDIMIERLRVVIEPPDATMRACRSRLADAE
ncbi:hypothetical protein DDZ18_08270 [Marinicauda salina]|uniref:Uncharacterized protein n=1 Tax=Marinicauda salina TaxID=2135793 RepID=A0A2U2BUK8_9PROT|nr:hypothetical protein [Marinicauda salina]PWE17644.1 hypothetical protein DDZ18_08270 [Marinicauda salina]